MSTIECHERYVPADGFIDRTDRQVLDQVFGETDGFTGIDQDEESLPMDNIENRTTGAKPTLETVKAVINQLVGKEVTVRQILHDGQLLATGVLQTTFGSKHFDYVLVAEEVNIRIAVGGVENVRLHVTREGEVQLYIGLPAPTPS